MARDLPIACVRRWDPPAPGMIPSLISGCPKTADLEQYRISAIMASSQPPPKAYPFTAAINGFFRKVMRSDQDSMKSVP